MKQIKDPERKIPVMAETDVLVMGGGPAGLSVCFTKGTPTR